MAWQHWGQVNNVIWFTQSVTGKPGMKWNQPHVIHSGGAGTYWPSPRRPCCTPPSSSTFSSRAEPSSPSISCRTVLAPMLSSTQCTSSSLSLTSSSWFRNIILCVHFQEVWPGLFSQGCVPWVILYRSYTSHPEVWSQFHPRSVILLTFLVFEPKQVDPVSSSYGSHTCLWHVRMALYIKWNFKGISSTPFPIYVNFVLILVKCFCPSGLGSQNKGEEMRRTPLSGMSEMSFLEPSLV